MNELKAKAIIRQELTRTLAKDRRDAIQSIIDTMDAALPSREAWDELRAQLALAVTWIERAID